MGLFGKFGLQGPPMQASVGSSSSGHSGQCGCPSGATGPPFLFSQCVPRYCSNKHTQINSFDNNMLTIRTSPFAPPSSVSPHACTANFCVFFFYRPKPKPSKAPQMCVFITAGPSTKLFTWGGGGYGRTCATRDDEPRPVWTRCR
jgi:hypothetical protein